MGRVWQRILCGKISQVVIRGSWPPNEGSGSQPGQPSGTQPPRVAPCLVGFSPGPSQTSETTSKHDDLESLPEIWSHPKLTISLPTELVHHPQNQGQARIRLTKNENTGTPRIHKTRIPKALIFNILCHCPKFTAS